jgi:proteic killer suppression protein
MSGCITLDIYRVTLHLSDVIKSFRCKDTRALFEGRCPRRFKAFAIIAERKLQMIDTAKSIIDFKSPPGNRLELLKGTRQRQWSIRINDQWRVCFYFSDRHASEVEIVDYH